MATEPLVDGELLGYMEADLTAVDSEDPLVAMLNERLELKEEVTFRLELPLRR